MTEILEDEINYPQGLVLIPRETGDGSVVAGPHIRGNRLRASSSTGYEEVDLLLPGTARYDIDGFVLVVPLSCLHLMPQIIWAFHIYITPCKYNCV